MPARRSVVASYLLGAATLEALVLALVLAQPVQVIAGTPDVRAGAAAPAPQRPPAPQMPAPPPDSPTPAGPSASPTPSSEPHERAPATPVRGQRPGTIRLPHGGTATLVRKEVGPGAVLPIPQNLAEATWWGAGLDAPNGASVFAGHVNWKGKEGPFAELWTDRGNEPVTVTDDSGTPWVYRISQVITLHKNELPRRADELFNQEGKHRIVLVTCGGRWLGGTTGYAENRVVIAEPDG